MNTFGRVAITAVVGIAAYFFVYWVPGSIFVPVEQFWIANVIALTAAIAAGRFIWRRTAVADKGLFTLTLTGALIVGGIGFAGGFFGPMIFAPGANQGPLLGLFITGPLGFLLGGIGGLIYGLTGRNRSKSMMQ